MYVELAFEVSSTTVQQFTAEVRSTAVTTASAILLAVALHCYTDIAVMLAV